MEMTTMTRSRMFQPDTKKCGPKPTSLRRICTHTHSQDLVLEMPEPQRALTVVVGTSMMKIVIKHAST